MQKYTHNIVYHHIVYDFDIHIKKVKSREILMQFIKYCFDVVSYVIMLLLLYPLFNQVILVLPDQDGQH